VLQNRQLRFRGKKISRPRRDSNPRAVQPIASLYSDGAVPTPVMLYMCTALLDVSISRKTYMVIILRYQFALKCAFVADSVFRGVHFLKALEVDERHIAVVWNVTPFSLMDRCKPFGDASDWSCAGWKSKSRGSFGGGGERLLPP